MPAPGNANENNCGGGGLACASCVTGYVCDPERLVCIANSTIGPDCSYSPVQALSEPCCSSYGADACGAGLFCAAFDGRHRETCYANYSRLSFEACTEDRQCASHSCNTSVYKCRSAQYELCTTSVGCAPTNAIGEPLTCTPDGADMRCII